MVCIWINTVALVMGAFGVGLNIKFGWPQPLFLNHPRGVILVASAPTKEQGDAIEVAKLRHRRWAKLGPILIALGFIIQLFALWLPVVGIC